ncbi:MAG TPA: AGE family epimerase/isomerase, partial [Opitutaceae bacterium]|nr:AGE family epimerase/isomerase [Opitutaceae bacterium]
MEPPPRTAEDPPAPPELAGSLVRRVLADLRGNILPFWIEHAVDREAGGFVGALTDDLEADPAAERGALLASRILWTYSAAWARFPDPALRRMADYAYRTLLERFHDAEHGGFWWSVGPDGSLRDGRKQVYGQAFAVFALSEYAAATGREEPRNQAWDLFRLLETRARDLRHGGFLEAFGRAWE